MRNARIWSMRDVLSSDPLLDALIAELDQAIRSLRAARKLIADRQRSRRTGRATPPVRVYVEPSGDVAASLRHSGITVAEAAAILGVGEEQVRRLLRRGDLEGMPYGGRTGWRLSRSYVQTVAAEWKAAREGQLAAKSQQREPRRDNRRRRR